MHFYQHFTFWFLEKLEHSYYSNSKVFRTSINYNIIVLQNLSIMPTFIIIIMLVATDTYNIMLKGMLA